MKQQPSDFPRIGFPTIGRQYKEDTPDGGDSPIHLAATAGHREVLGMLLEHAGSYQAAPNDLGNMPIHQAAQEAQPDCVELLLQHGADPNHATSFRVQVYHTTGNLSPLHLAIATKFKKGSPARERTIRILLKYGANVNAR